MVRVIMRRHELDDDAYEVWKLRVFRITLLILQDSFKCLHDLHTFKILMYE